MKIKGFDENLRCRGFQFEVGKEYKIDSKELSLCSDTVFHYCDSLQGVHDFYEVTSNNRYCEIEVLGEEITDGQKWGSNHIKILREITGEELNDLKGLNNGNTGLFNTGHRNTGNSNTGNRNTGHRNTGHRNTGDWNTGDFNVSNSNTGCFNAEEHKILIFDSETDMTYSDWINSKARMILNKIKFIPCEWIYSEDMTEDEKKENLSHETTGGYLKKNNSSDCNQEWWDNLTEDEKEVIYNIPNFDKDKFEQIMGIKTWIN